MGEDDEDLFNPRMLFDTSGAANFGINNDSISFMFWGKTPVSCKTWFMRNEELDGW